jgi:hypothetical protein
MRQVCAIFLPVAGASPSASDILPLARTPIAERWESRSHDQKPSGMRNCGCMSETIERTRKDKREGKAPSTRAGEFVREEIELIRQGAHGARSAKQAIAIGLSKARRAGVKLPPPRKGPVPEETRQKAMRDLERSRKGGKKPVSRKRSRATLEALRRESRMTVTKEALSKQTRGAAQKRTPTERSAAARKGVRTRASRK